MSAEKLTRRTLNFENEGAPEVIWREYRDSLSKKSSDVLNNILTFNKGHEVSTTD